jgi:RNA polymerase sigma-54 factor
MRLGHSLNPTFQLRQHLVLSQKILQLDLCELDSFIEQQIIENPLIDLKRKSPNTAIPLSQIEATPTTYESLIAQIPLYFDEPKEKEIAKTILGNLDSCGFFFVDITPFVATHNCTKEIFLKVLKTIQTHFDPVGIASSDYKSYLLTVLRKQNKSHCQLYFFIKSEYENLLAGKRSELKKKYALSDDDFDSLCRDFHSIPSSPIQKNHITPPTPKAEVHFFQRDDQWHFSYITETLPNIYWNEKYLQNGSSEIGPLRRKAIELEYCINNRKQTLTTLCRILLREKIGFFYPDEPHKELSIQALAKALKVHPSTMYRILQNKFALVEDEIVPFKKMIQSSCEKDNTKEKIKKYALLHPSYTDKEILQKLKEENITISRRTVAKYRKEISHKKTLSSR